MSNYFNDSIFVTMEVIRTLIIRNNTLITLKAFEYLKY